MKVETIVIITLIIIIILMVMHKRNMNQPAPVPNAPAGGTVIDTPNGPQYIPGLESGKYTPGPSTQLTLNYNKVLTNGSSGPEVTQLQKWLNVPTTGYFDTTTADALNAAIGETVTSLSHFRQIAPTASIAGLSASNYNFSQPDFSGVGLAAGSVQLV